MSPEAKEVLDYLLAFAGPGAAGGIALAILGWLKARSEKPHIAAPTVNGGLAQIGGMVMAQSMGQDIIDALRGIAASHDRCTLAREAEMQHRKAMAEEQRTFVKKQNELLHDDHRELVDGISTLNARLRDVHLAK